MVVKHLFSDIDGTLIQNDEIDSITLTKIKQFIKDGNKFYLASGRIDSDIKYLIDKHLKITVDYRISQNGTVITDKSNKIISTNPINLHSTNTILDYLFSLQTEELSLEFSDLHNRYLTKVRPATYLGEFVNITVVKPNLRELIGKTIFPTVILLLCHDYDYIKRIQRHINDNFKEVNAIMTNGYSLEIININSSKGNAINQLVEKYNINRNDVYVVGDNENDVSMFNEFSNSFVMSTAREHVKKSANYMVNVVGEVIDSIK